MYDEALAFRDSHITVAQDMAQLDRWRADRLCQGHGAAIRPARTRSREATARHQPRHALRPDPGGGYLRVLRQKADKVMIFAKAY